MWHKPNYFLNYHKTFGSILFFSKFVLAITFIFVITN